jgi:hypothetical protein
MTAKGRVVAKDVTLERKDEMSAAQTSPDNVASQLALLTGDAEKTVTMSLDGSFSVTGGEVIVSPVRTTVGDTQLLVEGTVDLESGELTQTATLAKSPSVTSSAQNGAAALAMPVGGTVRQPVLGVLNLKTDMPDASLKALNERVNQQITRMRARETQLLMLKSQNKVQEMLRPLQPPTTMPVK